MMRALVSCRAVHPANLPGGRLDPPLLLLLDPVDGLVLVRADGLRVGELTRVRVERALAYDLLARPV